VAIGVCVVLPLSLVKDITSLSSASKVAIAIYTIFVLQVMWIKKSRFLSFIFYTSKENLVLKISLFPLQLLLSTLPRIVSGDWVNGINFWRPDGVLQCLPIFGISFLCQT
jgi:sodium-coupled neutral amino acid transporter 10